MLTMNQLKRRGHHLASRCPFCRKNEKELEHLLVHCPKIWGLWGALTSVPRVAWVCPQSVKDLILCWNIFLVRKHARKIWKVAPLSLIWAIWKKKNKIVFDDATFSYDRMKLSFRSSLTSWAGSFPNMDLSIEEYFCVFSNTWIRVGEVSCFFLFLPLFCIGLLAPLYTPCIRLGCLFGFSLLGFNIHLSLPIKKIEGASSLQVFQNFTFCPFPTTKDFVVFQEAPSFKWPSHDPKP